jgi:anaerobic selenocysteine-containing dehydrogenase
MKTPNPSRRNFLKLVAGTAVALPFGYSLLAHADAAMPHLAPDDPSAKALGYTENAAKIDAAKEAAYKKGSKCAGCALFQAAQAKGGYAPCAAFPGKSVNANGWCRAFAAKA